MAARFRGGRGNLEIAIGVGLLALSMALLLRAVGWWFSDAIVWPAVAAAVGGALIWRQFVAAPGDAAPAPRALDDDAKARCGPVPSGVERSARSASGSHSCSGPR